MAGERWFTSRDGSALDQRAVYSEPRLSNRFVVLCATEKEADRVVHMHNRSLEEKGSAEAATSPSHGPNNPSQENAVNGAEHSTASAPRKPGFLDLEGAIGDVYRLAHITSELLDALLSGGAGVKDSPYKSFSLTDDQIGDCLFVAGEAQYRARLLRNQFYETVEAGSAV